MAALNQLLPMQSPNGDRVFVNQWDVPQRKAQGWEVIGDITKHVARVTAPTEDLAKTAKAEKPAASEKGKTSAKSSS